MLINKLRDYYGFPDNEQAQYINNKTKDMPEEQQDEIAGKIIETRSKRFGFPDISVLAKYLNNTAAKEQKVYYWVVCDDCKAEYDYRFERCPKCHLAGKRSSGYKVRTSNTPPSINVIQWNMTTFHTEKDIKTCIRCDKRDSGYCRWFGNPNYTCRQSDYEYCECKQCCAISKKDMQRLIDVRTGRLGKA